MNKKEVFLRILRAMPGNTHYLCYSADSMFRRNEITRAERKAFCTWVESMLEGVE